MMSTTGPGEYGSPPHAGASFVRVNMCQSVRLARVRADGSQGPPPRLAQSMHCSHSGPVIHHPGFQLHQWHQWQRCQAMGPTGGPSGTSSRGAVRDW